LILTAFFVKSALLVVSALLLATSAILFVTARVLVSLLLFPPNTVFLVLTSSLLAPLTLILGSISFGEIKSHATRRASRTIPTLRGNDSCGSGCAYKADCCVTLP
jgi:hypothetical protein